MARILIAGCGSIGIQLGSQLQTQGHDVFGLRRSDTPLPFTRIRADLTAPLDPDLLPPKLDYIIYTATPDTRGEKAYQSAYFDGVNNLIETLKEQRPQRFFFVSSTAVYHQTDGSWVNELSDTKPERYNGKIIVATEQQLADAPFPTTNVRFGGIYGGNRTRMLDNVRNGTTVQQKPAKYTNRIHQDDCVGVLAYLIALAERYNPQLEDCYLAVDCEPASEFDVIHWLAKRLLAPAPKVENISDSSQNKRCDNARLLAAGYEFKYPTFREGYEEMIQRIKMTSGK